MEIRGAIEELLFECKVSQTYYLVRSVLLIYLSEDKIFYAFFCFLVAVITCFLLCWTPYHVQRIMFIILTRTESWSPHLMRIQETLHIVSGKKFIVELKRKGINNSSIKLIKLGTYLYLIF